MVEVTENLKKADNFDYSNFFKTIKNRVVSARINFSRQANREASDLYWFIGQMIADNQKKHGWGKSIVETLSKDLKRSFPDVKFGFSERNMWDMRKFYIEYKDNEKLRQLVAELGWGSNLVIMSKVKDIKAREYYLRATIEMGWTRDVLTLQIKSSAYERHYLINKTHNFEKALPEHLAEQADRTLKSVYSLEMLGISKPVLEKELNKRMVAKIKEVLLELGHGFTFVGSEYRIVSPNGDENYIDLLFFNRKLNALVACELKTGQFDPEHAGKMNYYLELLDDFVREPHENPSIGIILCAEKDHFRVEYALRSINKPIGVSEYILNKNLPKDVLNMLPDPKKLKEKILDEMDL